MIRINLLGRERPRAKAPLAFDIGKQLTAICTLIVLVAAVLIGWRFWSLRQESARLDTQIAAAQQELSRLRSIVAQVEEFDRRRKDLEKRVSLIEQLRREQTGPVHLLDEISRALPPMLWLTDVKQVKGSNDVVVEGRCTALTSLSDLVTNLQASGYFKKSIEIVSTTTEVVPTRGEVIKFSIRGVFQQPGPPAGQHVALPPAPTAPGSQPRGD